MTSRIIQMRHVQQEPDDVEDHPDDTQSQQSVKDDVDGQSEVLSSASSSRRSSTTQASEQDEPDGEELQQSTVDIKDVRLQCLFTCSISSSTTRTTYANLCLVTFSVNLITLYAFTRWPHRY